VWTGKTWGDLGRLEVLERLEDQYRTGKVPGGRGRESPQSPTSPLGTW
jgi:hypothetical protein